MNNRNNIRTPIKYIALILALALMLPTLTGCAGSVELNKLAIVMGLGVDAAPNNEILVTAQVAKPSSFSSEASSGPNDETFFNVQQTSSGIFTATHDIMDVFSRRLFTQQCEVLVVGSELASQSMDAVLEYYMRNMQIRMSMPILIADGTAADILSEITYLEIMPAVQLSNLSNNQNYTTRAAETKVFEFIADYLSEAKQPTAPLVSEYVDNNGNKKARVSGTAICRADRMVYSLTHEEAVGFLIITNDLKSMVMNITSFGGLIELDTLSCFSSITPHVGDDGVPWFRLKVRVKSDIISTTSDQTVNTDEARLAIEEYARQEITARIMSAFEAAKKYQSDFLGFGELFYQTHPDDFERIDETIGWGNALSEMRLELDVEVAVLGTGAKLKPVKNSREREEDET